jgi:hypothetical protein
MKKSRWARLTRAQRWALECLLRTPLCVRGIMRRNLQQRRLARLCDQRCSQHDGRPRMLAITTKGHRALGRGVVREG